MTPEDRPEPAPQDGALAPEPEPASSVPELVAPDAAAADTSAVEVVPDVEPDPESAPTAPALPPGRRPRGLVIACAALFALSVVLGILTAVLASKLDREVATRDDVEETAGRFATALLTYHFEDLERSKQAVLELSTGNFRREYEQAFSGGLEVLITETQAASEGTVTDIFVGDVEDDTAAAIVVADVRVTGTAGERRSASSYIQLDLVRVAGRWRVDGVTNLNFGQNGAVTGVPSAPATTSSAPPR